MKAKMFEELLGSVREGGAILRGKKQPSRRFVIIPDKGLDAVFVLAFDAQKGRLSLHRRVAARAGAP